MKYQFLFILLPAICCVAAILYSFHQKEPVCTIPAVTEADRTAWLATQGWQGECIASRAVTIPNLPESLSSGQYAGYVQLQERQGLPLQTYAGKPGIVYTYQLEGSTLYAQLLTADGVLVGVQCYDPQESVTLDMQGQPVGRCG